MENIHSTIVELGTIFRQLAEMVQEQEEQVARYTLSFPSLLTHLFTSFLSLILHYYLSSLLPL